MALATTSWPRATQPWSRWLVAYVVCGNTFRTKPSTCSPQHVASHGNLASSGGNRITSVDQLNSTERKRFLEQQDPMRMFNFKKNTPVYRTMSPEFLVDGRVSGNPISRTWVRDHESLRPNPNGGFPEGTSNAYWPVIREARDLGPSLNVMTGGPSYSRDGRDGDINVRMRLGDFIDRGGKVYLDNSAAGGDRQKTIPLVITLPEG
ncbi:AvrPphF family type III effector, partial [Pseudomonas amygdali]|uniref:AvrPphF family type III effector n=1 Tax=Pseudomonas amygdali TaxID=47877 RepID=UPI00117B85B2